MRARPFFSPRRLGQPLGFYIVAELFAPTLWALFGLTALVLTKDLLGFSDLVINRGLGLAAVSWIAFYELVPLLSRTLPFAVLVGTLVGLGRLRADRELLAIEAAGLARRHLVLPILSFATVMTLFGLGFSLFTAPAALRSLDDALRSMIQQNPGVALRPGSVHEFGDARMVAREISARGDNLRGVLLWLSDTSQEYFAGQTLFAERGTVQPLAQGSARLVLYDGVILLSPQEGGGETRFQTFETVIRETPPTQTWPAQPLTRLSFPALMDHVRATAPAGESPAARRARTELHRRFAAPAAGIVFSLLALPLVYLGSRFSRASGGVLGLVLTVVYYGFTQLGDGLAQAGALTVGLGVWLPNMLVGGLAVLLIWLQDRPWVKRRSLDKQPVQDLAQAAPPTAVRTRQALLPRYVLQHYLLMLGLAFGFLLVGYLLVDILERLDWFARHKATPVEALRFYSARTPLLASRIVPMALLLATALTVSLLSFHRELIGMRACGISATRTLSCMLLVAGLITPLSFVLNESVVPRSNALADRLKETEIKDRALHTGALQKIVWYRAGSHVSQANQLDPALEEATDLSIYELGDQGLPLSRTDARRARHIGNGLWELDDPVRIRISENGLQREPAESLIQLGEAPDVQLDTMHLSVWQLAQEIIGTELAGYDVTTYRVDLNVKYAAPLACVLLPAIVLFFALHGPPFPGPAVTLLVSSVLGVGYVLLTGVCASLGYGGSLSPTLAGWGPALSATLLAGVFAWRNQG